LTKEALAALLAHDFPGNVRELENALTSAAALSANGLIALDSLPRHIVEASSKSAALAASEAADQLIRDQPTMDVLQARYLQLVLQQVEGNRHRAAKVLGLNRRTVQRLIAKYSLEALAETDADAEETTGETDY
jgi:DNA-binding NtrC family response regulator